MKVKSLFLIAFLVICVGCRRAPIQDLSGNFEGTYTNTSMEYMHKVIYDACTEKSWVPQEKIPGTIEAKLIVAGKHTMVVAIRYTSNSYKIKYKSSNNMKEKIDKNGVKLIHKNYNVWVNQLREAIDRNYLTYYKDQKNTLSQQNASSKKR